MDEKEGLYAPSTVNPLLARQVAAQRAAYPRAQLNTPQQALDLGAGLLGMVPGIGDAMGLAADVNRYRTEPESRTLPNFGLTALGLLPFMPGMTVFHGSPHKFDKFDMSKVGTGEGAQSYGHGLYFSQNPNVAKSYAELPTGKLAHKVTGEVVDTRSVPMGRMTEYGPATPNVYKVDLPDEQIGKMLDWDKPISQELRQRVIAALPEGKKDLSGMVVGADRSSAYRSLVRGEAPLDGAQLYGLLEGEFGRQRASEILKSLGFPGIKYLDAGSRSAGKGTSNFVVFDDQLPKIVGRE